MLCSGSDKVNVCLCLCVKRLIRNLNRVDNCVCVSRQVSSGGRCHHRVYLCAVVGVGDKELFFVVGAERPL